MRRDVCGDQRVRPALCSVACSDTGRILAVCTRRLRFPLGLPFGIAVLLLGLAYRIARQALASAVRQCGAAAEKTLLLPWAACPRALPVFAVR